jgi:class 3 adenylate cyclase/tetratricopeptide (TPR) repeat protein
MAVPTCPTCGAGNPEGAKFCNACGARLGHSARGTDEPSGERRVVTMLFCDVRGSTAMAEELDPEEWTDVMNAAFEQLIAPVYRYEGTVARLMGDAILAFFGAPTAHEDDPQRAVMAGLEIVASIGPLRERLSRERDLDLNVRVGINTGPVVVGDVGSELRQEYSAMGDAVNVAARMEQTAEPGTVQITEETYRLVADLFDVEPLGDVALKGKRRPVPSYRVLGRLASRWRTRAARPLEVALVGRDRELGVVRSALLDATRGTGSVVMIVGEPGIGKSRLVEEASELWNDLEPDDDRRWGYWQCVPYDTMQPYAQYRRVIRERAGIGETDPPDVTRAKIADLLRPTPEGWRQRSERVARALLAVELPDEPQLEGEEFQREVTDLLVESTLAQGGRRLVVYEDLHWCDHASLELVRATTALVQRAPIVFLITFRPDREAISWDFKECVESDLPGRCKLVELRPLTEEESDDLVDELLPIEQLPGDIRRQILAKTEGNPLFLQEVARALIDRGFVERVDDEWRLVADTIDVAIPDSIQSLITVGLDRLPDTARRTLQTAAVIGRTFDEELLGSVADGGDVDEDLRELERRDLIRATGRGSRPEYSFRHAITQEAAYGTLLAKQRRAAHRRVAHALEEAGTDRLEEVAPLLVRHYSEAAEDGATLKYAAMAGEAATRLYANAEAAALYRVGLDTGLRIEADSRLLRAMYEQRGDALELLGRYDDAIANYEEMRATAATKGDKAMELAANTAIALLYSTPTPKFDPDRGRRLSEENVAMARRLGDRRAEARALWNIVVANVYGGGDPVRAVEAGEESLALARELEDRGQLAFTLNDVSRAHMANGDFATAATRLEEARALWEELDNRPMLSENLTVRSSMALLKGNHVTALTDARTALSISESIGNDWGQSHALISVYRAQLDIGEVGEAMASMERCLELGERGGFTFAGVVTRADQARAYAYLGNCERALPLAEQALEIAHERLPPAVSLAHIARAEVFMAQGNSSAAGAALDEIDRLMLPEPDRTFLLVASRLARSRLAVATAPQKAARIASDVVEHLRANDVRIMVAESLCAVAAALTAAARFEDAERELADALAEAERLGEHNARWKALALMADVHDQRGASAQAAEYRRRAREIVERIAAGVPEESLRRSFLAREDIQALGSAAG